MNTSQLDTSAEQVQQPVETPSFEPTVDVKTAARFLGVSPSLVYAYVERKQIPHFRMMGRTIRFSILNWKSGDDNFSSMEESMSRKGRPRKADGAVYQRKDSVFWWVRYRDQQGQIVKESP